MECRSEDRPAGCCRRSGRSGFEGLLRFLGYNEVVWAGGELGGGVGLTKAIQTADLVDAFAPGRTHRGVAVEGIGGGAAEVTITQLLGDFRQDVARRLYVAPEVDEGEAARIGENLADHYSVRLGTRSLDVRHVAWALAAGATAFVTGDERPARWAEAIGLKMTRL